MDFDSNLFNPRVYKTYELDNYQGDDKGFVLGTEFKIPDSLIKVFTLTSDDNGNKAKIWAIYIGDTVQIATDTVFMYCHGNYSHMDVYWQRAKILANLGGKNRFGVLMLDYRGFGASEGKSSESTLYADVDAGVQWLKAKGLTGERLLMYGFSLGSGPSTELTANPRSLTPSKLMLEAPYASTQRMMEDGTALAMPISFIAGIQVNNAAKIAKVQQPFFWTHGDADHFLSMKTHGQAIYDNYNGTYKAKYIVAGAGHSQVPQGFDNDPDTQKNHITAYMKELLAFVLR
jgi:pimeloyl-ACP methyl ester carboxylesterase